jgi:hypothetical protein
MYVDDPQHAVTRDAQWRGLRGSELDRAELAGVLIDPAAPHT